MNQKLAIEFYLTLAITNYLLEDGTLNTEAIPLILRYLEGPQFLQGKESAPCIKRIREILIRLQNKSNGLAETIDKIDAWNEEAPARCRLMITSTLNLPFDSEITPALIKKTILKGILDYPRQVETNDCQAQWEVISFSQFRPEYTLADYIDLVIVGALKRIYKGELVTMTFPPYMACNTSRDLIAIDKSGAIVNNSFSKTITIWDALPIQSALNQMNLPYNDEKLNQLVINELFKNSEEPQVQVNALQIITAYANSVYQSEEAQELIERGYYGFAALRNSPLQRALVSAILYACEYTPGPSPVNWVVESASRTFESYLEKLNASESGAITRTWNYLASFVISQPAVSSDSAKIIQLFSKKMHEITTLQYEQHQMWDATGTYGQNVCYQKDKGAPFNDLGKRISCAKEFQELVQKAIDDAQQELEEQAKVDKEKSEKLKDVALAILQKMKDYSTTEEFVNSCCQRFSSHYGDPVDGVDPHSQNLPWRFFKEPLGRSSTWVYLNQEQPDPSIVTRIKGSEGIDNTVKWWMENVAGIDNLSLNLEENPITYNGTIFASWFVHSFNWIFDHPSLLNLRKTMIEENCSWQEALDQAVIEPSNQIADSPLINGGELLDKLATILCEAKDAPIQAFESIPLEEKEDNQHLTEMDYRTYLARLKKTVSSRINLEEVQASKEWFEIGIEGKMTIYEASQMLINYLNTTFNPEENPVIEEVINGFITLAVIDNLSNENYELLANSALHIADTNWLSHTNSEEFWEYDTHFCFFQSPALKQLTIGMIDSNKAHMAPLPLTTHIGGWRLNLKTVPQPILVEENK